MMSGSQSQPVEVRFQSRARRFHSVQGWLLALSATVLAASGQIEFAVSADITDVRRFLVPAILEIAAVFVVLGGYLRACEGDSPTLMWLLAAGITAFAVWTNLEHGGPRAGRIYAAATVLTFVLWLLKLRDHYRAARRASGLVESPTARFRLVRWLVMPRLTRRAWLISVEYNLRDADTALRLARLWRDTFTDTRAAPAGPSWVRRRAGRRAAGFAVRSAAAFDAAAYPPARDTSVAAQPEGATPARGRPGAGRRRPRPAQPGNAAQRRPRRSPAGRGGANPSTRRSARPYRHRVIHRRNIPEHPNAVSPAAPVRAAAVSVRRPRPRAGAVPRADGEQVYRPINAQDAVMYAAWRASVVAGREPSGADLARAAGRPDDSTGVGRRAARRYRQSQVPTVPDTAA
jgi:hypothetical protein